MTKLTINAKIKITRFLNAGVKHYHPETSQLLATAVEIVDCIRDCGEVTVDGPLDSREYIETIMGPTK